MKIKMESVSVLDNEVDLLRADTKWAITQKIFPHRIDMQIALKHHYPHITLDEANQIMKYASSVEKQARLRFPKERDEILL